MDQILSLLGLIALQIVLGIDNVIFLSILTSDLPATIKDKARKIGVLISMALNSVLILAAGYLSGMENKLFSIGNTEFTIHGIIMLAGGMFLMYKAVKELYNKLEGKHTINKIKDSSFVKIILLMATIDLVFSIDSAITAIGMSSIRWVQIIATLVAIIVMFFFFTSITSVTEKHPSFKILSLAFLVLIGFSLFVEGMGIEIPKGYIYFAMAFSVIMEILNIRLDKKISK